MKKSRKIILTLIPVFLVLVMMVGYGFNFVYADNDTKPDPIIKPVVPEGIGNDSIGTVNTAVGKIWGTVTIILQIAAIGAIIFAGVRYMFASADTKADIKKQTVILAVGAILVFGASSLVQFLTGVLDEVI